MSDNTNKINVVVPNSEPARDSKDCAKKYIARTINGTICNLCLVFNFFAYYDEFRNKPPSSAAGKNPKSFRTRGYGLGYKTEALNQVLFVAIISSFVFTIAVATLKIFWIDLVNRWKKIYRLTHLAFALFFLAAWICGINGTLQFASNCCHISHGLPINTNYNKSPGQGYSDRCECTLTVRWKPEYVYGEKENVTITEFWSHEIYNKSESIIRATPHNFDARCFFLGVVTLWLALYVTAFFGKAIE